MGFFLAKAKDIYNLAVISLWGAFRISESVFISRLTAVLLSRQDLLRVTVFDAKSTSGDKLQWKYICSFPEHPDFCPHEAFKQLLQVKHYELLVSVLKTTLKQPRNYRRFSKSSLLLCKTETFCLKIKSLPGMFLK